MNPLPYGHIISYHIILFNIISFHRQELLSFQLKLTIYIHFYKPETFISSYHNAITRTINLNMLTQHQANNQSHSFQLVYNAIYSLVNAHDQNDINMATQLINNLQNTSQYIQHLIAITISNQPDYNISLAAITQLKVVIREHWRNEYLRPNTWQIIQEDKQQFVKELFKHHCQLNSNYKFNKIIKDIVELVARDALSQIPNIIGDYDTHFQGFRMGELKTFLNFLLGVFGGLRMHMDQPIIAQYNKYTQGILKYMDDLLQVGQKYLIELYYSISDHEIDNSYAVFTKDLNQFYYLLIKLLAKISNLDLNDQSRISILKWWEICAVRFKQEEKTLYINSDETLQQDQAMGQRGNERFIYFHEKKWMCKFIQRLMQRWLVRKHNNTKFNDITRDFYKQNLLSLLSTIRNNLQYILPIRIKYEQLKCLQKIIQCKKETMFQLHRSELDYYLKQKLPEYIKLTDKEYHTIHNNPMDFILSEMDYGGYLYYHFRAKDVRKCATDIWLLIAKIESQIYKNLQECPYFNSAFRCIESFIKSNDLSLMEVGCYLLVKLKPQLIKNAILLGDLRDLLNEVIKGCLRQNIKIFEVRALELISAYNELIDEQALEMALKLITEQCLSRNIDQVKGQWLVLIIKSSFALEKIIRNKRFKSYINLQGIKYIINYLYKLVCEIEYDQVMNSLILIIDAYSNLLIDDADKIFQYMSDLFKVFIEKDIQNQKERPVMQFTQKYQQIANGTLSIIRLFTKYINQGQNKQFVNHMQAQIINVLEYLFSHSDEIVFDYHENAIYLLNSYLFYYPSNRQLSRKIWFFLKAIILKITGLPQKVRLKAADFAQKNKNIEYKILSTCKNVQIYNLQSYVTILRNYIKFFPAGQNVRKTAQYMKNLMIDINPTELLLCLVNQFYNNKYHLKEDNQHMVDQISIEVMSGRIFTTLIFVYLLEFQKVHESLEMKILYIIVQNLKTTQKYAIISKYNIQLMSMWMWRTDNIYKYHKTHDHFINLTSKIMSNSGKQKYGLYDIKQYSERLRIILGLIKFANYLLDVKLSKNGQQMDQSEQNKQTILNQNKILMFTILWLIHYVYENIRYLINDDQDEAEGYFYDEEDEIQDYLSNYDEEEDEDNEQSQMPQKETTRSDSPLQPYSDQPIIIQRKNTSFMYDHAHNYEEELQIFESYENYYEESDVNKLQTERLSFDIVLRVFEEHKGLYNAIYNKVSDKINYILQYNDYFDDDKFIVLDLSDDEQETRYYEG